MGATDYRQCAHSGCDCTVPENQEYCGPYCRKQAEGGHQQQQQQAQAPSSSTGNTGCGCGHAACQHAQ
jgi:hypothetical protein